MEDLSLHILDIVQNSIAAQASLIEIKIDADNEKDLITVNINDNGTGMDEETVKKVQDPFYTTKKGKRVGLGLALLTQSAQETGGDLKIDSKEGSYTRIKAVFKSDHPDMKPIGNINETMAVLVTGNPEVRFILDYREGDYNFYFDSQKC